MPPVPTRFDALAQPRAIVIDFGCAKKVNVAQKIVVESVYVNTYGFLGNSQEHAPEIDAELTDARNKHRDAVFDMSKQPSFELAVIGYLMCTGNVPMHLAVTEAYDDARLNALPSSYPDDFHRIMRRLAASDPGSRPGIDQAVDLLHALKTRLFNDVAATAELRAGLVTTWKQLVGSRL